LKDIYTKVKKYGKIILFNAYYRGDLIKYCILGIKITIENVKK